MVAGFARIQPDNESCRPPDRRGKPSGPFPKEWNWSYPNTVRVWRESMLARSPAAGKPGNLTQNPVAGDRDNVNHERY